MGSWRACSNLMIKSRMRCVSIWICACVGLGYHDLVGCSEHARMVSPDGLIARDLMKLPGLVREDWSGKVSAYRRSLRPTLS